MSAPPRSPEQRAAALEAAVASRIARARLRADLKAGRLTGADVLLGAEDDPSWARLPVAWLLASLPGIGPARAERILARHRIAPSRRIQGLGTRQRSALLDELRRDA